MKFCYTASIIAALMGSASAFVAPTLSTSLAKDVAAPTEEMKAVESPAESTAVKDKESTPVIAVEPVAVEEPAVPESKPYNPLGLEPGRYDSISYSKAIPQLKRPPKLDGSHAGDFGFDPLGFTEDYDLYYLQECEIRHARLAMLAVVGWPLSELVAPSWMLQDGCAPSVLNGVNPLSALAILVSFSAFGFFEYKTSIRRTSGTPLGEKHLSDMSNVWNFGVAGDYNFDPANFYSLLGDDAQGRKGLRELEITQGRYAMLGITSFALWEKLTGHPIVENSMFFHPNALLPFLALSYFGWSQIYEVSDVTEYPIKIQYTKDGEEILNGLKRNANDMQRNAESMKPAIESAKKQFVTIKGKIEELVDKIDLE